jgi:hypothetical protein
MRTSSWSPFILLILTALASGCVTPPKEHYYWGNYQTLILALYVEPGSVDSFTQIEKLTEDLQQAEGNGQAPPPGLYAHLGMMYAMNGDLSLAEDAFQQERDLFPEAAVFIDGMMARALSRSEATNANTK